jgi:hypothetical protein
MVMTNGARALRAYFERNGSAPQRDVADKCDVAEQTVWTWKTGRRRPGLVHRRLLRTLCGIAVDDWMTPPERRALERIKAA